MERAYRIDLGFDLRHTTAPAPMRAHRAPSGGALTSVLMLAKGEVCRRLGFIQLLPPSVEKLWFSVLLAAPPVDGGSTELLTSRFEI